METKEKVIEKSQRRLPTTKKISKLGEFIRSGKTYQHLLEYVDYKAVLK